MSASKITVAIVEDDPDLQVLLKELLLDTRFEVVATFSDAESAIRALAKNCPQLVIMDIQLPKMTGIECVSQLKLRQPSANVLMVTVYENNERVFDALAAGASGYLLKRDVPTKLIESLEDMLTGGSPMSSAIARKVVQHFQKTKAPSVAEQLTPRELQILELLAKGGLYKEIAADLGIGYETVRSHIDNIYKKLHVRTRTEAVVKFLS
jgi:DNA-binding NarL/FixJ family response regulator